MNDRACRRARPLLQRQNVLCMIGRAVATGRLLDFDPRKLNGCLSSQIVKMFRPADIYGVEMVNRTKSKLSAH